VREVSPPRGGVVVTGTEVGTTVVVVATAVVVTAVVVGGVVGTGRVTWSAAGTPTAPPPHLRPTLYAPGALPGGMV